MGASPKISVSAILQFSVMILLFSGLCLKHFILAHEPAKSSTVAIGGQQIPRDRSAGKKGVGANGGSALAKSDKISTNKGNASAEKIVGDVTPDFSSALLKCAHANVSRRIGGTNPAQQSPKALVKNSVGSQREIGGQGNQPAPRSDYRGALEPKQCCFSPDYFKSKRGQEADEICAP